MKDVHGEHISLGATGQWHGGSPVKQSGQPEQGSSMQRWTQRQHTSSQGSAGVSRLGTMGKVLASNGQIVCLFLWGPTKPNKGNFQLVCSHCTENILWPPRSPWNIQRQEREELCWPTGYIYSRGVNMLLWTGLCQQQDVWQSQRYISGTETLGHSFASYLFINVERWSGAEEQQVKDLPVCE